MYHRTPLMQNSASTGTSVVISNTSVSLPVTSSIPNSASNYFTNESATGTVLTNAQEQFYHQIYVSPQQKASDNTFTNPIPSYANQPTLPIKGQTGQQLSDVQELLFREQIPLNKNQKVENIASFLPQQIPLLQQWSPRYTFGQQLELDSGRLAGSVPVFTDNGHSSPLVNYGKL